MPSDSTQDRATYVLTGGHCVVFLCKTLYSHSASLHPGLQMGTDKFDARSNPAKNYLLSRGEYKYS